jgi:hypothetical protein
MVAKRADEYDDKAQKDYPLFTPTGNQLAHKWPTNNRAYGHQAHYPANCGFAAADCLEVKRVEIKEGDVGKCQEHQYIKKNKWPNPWAPRIF